MDRDNKVARVKSDSEMILASLTNDDAVILFDERGSKLSSEQHAERIQRVGNRCGYWRLKF